ncbi:MAG: C_GCAxxG_C_C family protein [Deltaproteobacteria bacterium]|nr:C_GCAxxG_C_C family protein [Deltaproteobacteria bacterium]MBN2844516.1 C_GCAxxG_C_C family protein [Deltaproteobacteria bacterium]
METKDTLTARLKYLEERQWNLPVIKEKFDKNVQNGFPQISLLKSDVMPRRDEILDLVQLRAEEYCYLTRNCARGTTTALFETFGLGSMDIIKGLAAMPGFGMTGGPCGAVTGGIIALALCFGDDDLINWEDIIPLVLCREYLARFEDLFGSTQCPGVQERIFGRYYDALANWENYELFMKARGREKCPLAPGMGARMVAEIIMNNLT